MKIYPKETTLSLFSTSKLLYSSRDIRRIRTTLQINNAIVSALQQFVIGQFINSPLPIFLCPFLFTSNSWTLRNWQPR